MNKPAEKYTTSQFYADIKAGKIAPLYLFYGEEDFVIKQMVETLQKAALKPGDADFNLDILYGNETEGAVIVNATLSFPMMAERRLVIVKDFHHLDEKGINLVIKYAAKPSPTTCLCLTSSKFTGTSSAIKKLSPFAKAIETKQLYDNQVLPWIKTHAKERGYAISDEAAILLQINVGNSLRRLASEIEKIDLLKTEKGAIGVADVEAVVGATKEFNVFEFCDAVADKNLDKSLRILNRLIELGEAPIGILAMLIRHFSLVTKTKEMLLKRAGKDVMAKNLRVNPFFVDKYIQHANKYKRAHLQRIFQLLLTSDQHLKSSYQKPKLILESLLFEIYSLA